MAERSQKAPTLSCAECRRLKLKCDRAIPCSTCVRRGCAKVCPHSTLPKAQRGFFARLDQVLPDRAASASGSASGGGSSEQELAVLREQTAAQRLRIQQLEEALKSIHSSPIEARSTSFESPNTHDKLSEASISLSHPLAGPSTIHAFPQSDQRSEPQLALPNEHAVGEITTGLGTLTLFPDGRSSYVGSSGASAYLDTELYKTKGGLDDRRHSEEDLHEEGTSGDAFPHLEWSTLLEGLPPREEALRLANNYFDIASFMYEIVPRQAFFTQHFPAIFPSATCYVPPHPHTYSLVTAVLALGTYFDISQPISEVKPKARALYQLVVLDMNIIRAALDPYRLNSVQAVQTLHLMALCELSTSERNGGNAAWQLLGLATRTILAMGMHREASKWGIGGAELEERRRVFWETHIYDRLQAFSFGRPYALNDMHHDCQLPSTCDTPLPTDDDPYSTVFSHTRWHLAKFRYAPILGRIVDQAFGVNPPNYATIISLDREIRQFYKDLPESMKCQAITRPVMFLPPMGWRPYTTPEELATLRKDSQIHSMANWVFESLLHLHRGAFSKALQSHKDPLQTPWAESVVAVCEASSAIINVARGIFAAHPAIACRMWYFLFHSFTAAVCMAGLVISAPSCPLSLTAWQSLLSASDLLENAEGERADLAAKRLKVLIARAQENIDREWAYDDRQQAVRVKCESGTEELLGATTKLVRRGDRREGPPSTESQRHDEPEPAGFDAVMEGFDVSQFLEMGTGPVAFEETEAVGAPFNPQDFDYLVSSFVMPSQNL